MPLLNCRAVGNGGEGIDFAVMLNLFISGGRLFPNSLLLPFGLSDLPDADIMRLDKLKVPLCVVIWKDIHNANKNFCASKLYTFRDKVAFIQADEWLCYLTYLLRETKVTYSSLGPSIYYVSKHL